MKKKIAEKFHYDSQGVSDAFLRTNILIFNLCRANLSAPSPTAPSRAPDELPMADPAAWIWGAHTPGTAGIPRFHRLNPKGLHPNSHNGERRTQVVILGWKRRIRGVCWQCPKSTTAGMASESYQKAAGL